MGPDALSEVRAKIERAKKHIGDLEAEIAAFKKNTGAYPTNTDTTMHYPNWTSGPYTVHRDIDGIGLWEIKFPERDDAETLARVRESGLGVTNCVGAVPSVLPLPLLFKHRHGG